MENTTKGREPDAPQNSALSLSPWSMAARDKKQSNFFLKHDNFYWLKLFLLQNKYNQRTLLWHAHNLFTLTPIVNILICIFNLFFLTYTFIPDISTICILLSELPQVKDLVVSLD